MKKNSFFITFIIILIAVGMIMTYSSIFSIGGQSNPQPNTSQPLETEPSSQTYSYQGEEGRTALEILKEKFSVETKASDFGEMVMGIEGKKADETKEFWAFKVNGEMALEGAGTYQTKTGETISWELTPIQ